MEILRFTTAGSVDDGKSTLIGRLLYDSKQIFEDQLDEISKASIKRGESGVNLALLTDGLRAEREQNITIDVAYRYFATPRRKFIIADTPGHEQYTRNMVTGASTANLAIILIDARKGVLVQSKRHASISSILRIPHIVVCVNKMDLVGYSRTVFQKIVDDFSLFAEKLYVEDITFIPISALLGDNVVSKSQNMPWYEGATLMYHLENVNISSDKNLIDFRFPVQLVIIPNQDFRGLAGRVSSGTIRIGEEIIVLPSLIKTKIKSIHYLGEEVTETKYGDSVVLSVTDNIDIGRGDMLVREKNVPEISTKFETLLCWMGSKPLEIGKQYILLHTTRKAIAFVTEIVYKLNVNNLHREEAQDLLMNEIGRVRVEVSQPLFFDSYRINRETGGFVLVDTSSFETVASGMIKNATKEEAGLENKVVKKSSNTTWEGWNISRLQRELSNKHKAAVFWFTGISASGKTTIARGLEKILFENGIQTILLDGDQVRHGLCSDLGFSDFDRKENIRRISELARLLFEHGNIVICTFISPFISDREFARSLIIEGRFFEVFVRCDLETAISRDPKGLYKKALSGEIKHFTGISSPYEQPVNPEILIDTTKSNPEEIIEGLIEFLKQENIIN